MPTFKSLYEENRDTLKLEWLAGRSSIDKPLDTPANAGLSSADLVGHLNLIHPNRLHVSGIRRSTTTLSSSPRAGCTTRAS